MADSVDAPARPPQRWQYGTLSRGAATSGTPP
jgi:hypothetical protein